MRLLVIFTLITAAMAVPVDFGYPDEPSPESTGLNPDITWDNMPIPDSIPGWRPVEEKDSIGDLPGDYDPHERYTSGAYDNSGRWSPAFQEIHPGQFVHNTLNKAKNGLSTILDMSSKAAGAAADALGLNSSPDYCPTGGQN